jgi:hypothetical protein
MNSRLGSFGQAGILTGAALLAIGTGAGAAAADPSAAHTDHGRHLGHAAAASPAASPAAPGHAARHPNAHANAHASAHAAAHAHGGRHASTGTPASSNAHQAGVANHPAGAVKPASATADPPGNNGTVKIARVGDLDRIPNNTPHPGCTFEVQWYGFDAGSDVVSHVSFTPQAPTSDTDIAVSGPTDVPVGEDAASGAGTATGLDAVETYTLSFSGGAPAKQGYHVRLTVSTPRSLGNDTKTKVFWVEPCAGAVAAPAAVSTAAPLAAAAAPAAGAAPVSVTPDSAVAPIAAAPSSDAAVPLGAERPAKAAATAGVPTVIDAGQHHSLLRRVATSPWAGGLVALGLAVALSGVLVGARRRA